MSATGYLLRIYGVPRIDDDSYDDADTAMAEARRILLEHGRPGYFAELHGRNGVVWTAYFENGKVIESNKQDPRDA